MKKSWKYGLIGAAAALAAVLLPYEIDRNDDGEFSYNSLLLGVYRRKRSDGEHATAVTLFNAPALTDESRKAREAAVRHVIEAAAEQELFADGQEHGFEHQREGEVLAFGARPRMPPLPAPGGLPFGPDDVAVTVFRPLGVVVGRGGFCDAVNHVIA